MKIAIMQPYFLPYVGYFQLAAAVDAFVIYDDVKYTKKGWINRNRILVNGAPATITLPLAAAPDSHEIRQRRLAAKFVKEADRMERRIAAAYRGAPFADESIALLQRCLRRPERNLFDFLHHALRAVFDHLGIDTPVHVSSTLGVDRILRSQERVISICSALGATCYVNPPGGRILYEHAAFRAASLELLFLEPNIPTYSQFGHPFVPALSIIDALMFNAVDQVRRWQAGVSLTA